MNPNQYVSRTLNIPEKQVAKTIELLEDGSTIPFISRYRKEATGGLDEVQIADIQRQLNFFKGIEKRKETILNTIDEQGKLSAELRAKIEQCFNESELEDIYLPYKPKRKTKADTAKENGLEPLAKIIMSQYENDIEKAALKFINTHISSTEEALEGARFIIAEWINENPKTRDFCRYQFEKQAEIGASLVKGKEQEADKYRDYFNYTESLKKAPAHRILALFRAENEGYLKLKIRPENEEQLIENIEKYYIKGKTEASTQVALAVKDAWKRLLLPSLETELRNKAKEKADKDSILVFQANLRNLLMEAPLGQKRTLAIDPGFRTGCKVVCLDENGQVLEYSPIFPHQPQNEREKSLATLQKMVQKHQIEAIAIGNGTAGRETEALVRSISFGKKLQIFMVSEDGASVYSASENGREEFPNYDITVRGAISIGRRLMDPLSELIKIDPKALGIGQYQHDVDQKLLKQELDLVVESSVNAVGVNINTASKHLLTYVSGLGPKIADNIVKYRQENGDFGSRAELKKVKGLGLKAFEQAAGFLRIPDAALLLDRTAVHPERYKLVQSILKDQNIKLENALFNADLKKQIDLKPYINEEVGLPTLNDILDELAKPGRDPRQSVQEFSFDTRLQSISDVREGMILPGIIGNVTNFGAFVNIGIKESGLVHISHLANKFVSKPADVVKLNQQVTVKVLEVDVLRKRIQLSIKEAIREF